MITCMPRVAIAIRDMDAAVRWFRDSLGLGVSELDGAIDSLGVRIAMCSSSSLGHIELMAPEQRERPLGQSLQRFLDGRGDGFYAMMLYAPDPDRESEEIEKRGLAALPLMPEATGRDFHPRGTNGVLIRVYPDASDSIVEDDLDMHLGPLEQRKTTTGLSGIRAVQIVVPDLEKAVAIYRDQFGLTTEVMPATDRGQVAVCTPASGGQIELHAPADTSTETGRFLQEAGPGLFAIVHESDNPEATAKLLEQRGVSVTRAPDGLWDLDRTEAFGALIRLRATSV